MHNSCIDPAAVCTDDWIADRPSRRSLETLQRTLTRTTERLAIELGRPGAKAPDWSEAEWAIARAVAAMHGVSPLLACTVRWQGPESWTRFLEAQRRHTAVRFVCIQRLLQLIDDRARAAAIPVVPLKGAALHALGIYAVGERPMADIDLLVSEEHGQRFAELLAMFGFSETYRVWRHQEFARHDDGEPAALGEDANNGIKIELRCRIIEALPRRLLDVSSLVFPKAPRPGLNSYPSKAALLLHLLVHTAGALVARCGRLLQLHDIARLVAVMSAADWEELSLLFRQLGDGSLWWAFPPLALVNRYFACLPEWLLRQAAADCHWTLRRAYNRRTLSESSYSHLWISALPGILWARSPAAMLEYAMARAIPDRALLRWHKALAQMQPRVYSGSWWQLSQGERIVRWMLSRQPRHESLQPVRAALRGFRLRSVCLQPAESTKSE